MKMMCCVIYHTWKVGIDHFVSNCSRPRRNNSMNYKQYLTCRYLLSKLEAFKFGAWSALINKEIRNNSDRQKKKEKNRFAIMIQLAVDVYDLRGEN